MPVLIDLGDYVKFPILKHQPRGNTILVPKEKLVEIHEQLKLGHQYIYEARNVQIQFSHIGNGRIRLNLYLHTSAENNPFMGRITDSSVAMYGEDTGSYTIRMSEIETVIN